MKRLFLVVLALLAIGAAPASATVVPGKGMAGVKMGDCADTVRATLGEPDKTLRDDDFAGPVITLVYKARAIRATFHFNGECQALTAISTTKGAERTAEGLGRGSALRSVRAKLLDSKRRVSRVTVGRVLD